MPNQDFISRIFLGSDFKYPTVEVLNNDEEFFILNRENEDEVPAIYIYPKNDNEPWMFSLESFEAILKVAKDKLILSGYSPEDPPS